MKLLDTFRSFFSGQTFEAFGEGQRFPLTKQMTTAIRRDIHHLEKSDLSAYTFERRHSEYPGAKSDVVVYDDQKTAIVSGRETSAGPAAFWKI